MANKPAKFPDWAVINEIDPVSGQNNVVEPPDDWYNHQYSTDPYTK
jgi:hypothetical protein